MTTEIITSKHYNGEIIIKFYPNSHRYQREGEKNYLVGVTTATGVLDKSRALLIWASRLSQEFLLEALRNEKPITEDLIQEAVKQHEVKKEEAATIGTLVHDYIEKHIKGKKPPMPTDKNVLNGVLACLKWITENDVRFVASEQFIYSKKYNYSGICDTIFTFGKEDHKVLHVGDWKTAKSVYFEMFAQVAAYQAAYQEEFGTEFGDAYILRLDKETGNFESKCLPKEEHEDRFKAFLNCLQLKEASKIWESSYGYYAKPKAQ